MEIMSQQLDLLTENHSQWTAVLRVTPEIQKKEIKPFVILALKEIEGNPDSRTSTLVNMDKFAAVREVVSHVARLRSATKQPWNCEDIMTFLEGLRFSPECVSEFTKLLCTDKIYDTLPSHLRIKPGVVGLQWKIDISLSQTNMQPDSSEDMKQLMHRNTHIILIFSLTDNSTQTYRLTISKFHELRFVIASALKNMIVLEKRKCMKKD